MSPQKKMVKSLKNGWSLNFLVTVLAVTELFSQGICSPAKNVGLGICSHGIDSLPICMLYEVFPNAFPKKIIN